MLLGFCKPLPLTLALGTGTVAFELTPAEKTQGEKSTPTSPWLCPHQTPPSGSSSPDESCLHHSYQPSLSESLKAGILASSKAAVSCSFQSSTAPSQRVLIFIPSTLRTACRAFYTYSNCDPNPAGLPSTPVTEVCPLSKPVPFGPCPAWASVGS